MESQGGAEEESNLGALSVSQFSKPVDWAQIVRLARWEDLWERDLEEPSYYV